MKKMSIGIVCNSNGLSREMKPRIHQLENVLEDMGLEAVFSDCIYQSNGIAAASDKARAEALMKMYANEAVDEIFDVSGGDLANGVLPYLDYELIGRSRKRFWGYSDLTTIINAVFARSGMPGVLYQLRNLVGRFGQEQTQNFYESFVKKGNALFDIEWDFIQGSSMEGVVVGGNIRCFLKLAGTPYMPELTDRLLLLESMSGTVPQMTTYLCQLQQMGAFDKVAGVLLGTFTQMEAEGCRPDMAELVKKYVPDGLPIARTCNIGHGADSKAIVIGEELKLSK